MLNRKKKKKLHVLSIYWSIIGAWATTGASILYDFLLFPEQQVLSILQERCDGNRNILHACVHMCAPTSNKEPDIGMYLVS